MGKRSCQYAFFAHTCLENRENHYNIKAYVGKDKENRGISAQLCQIGSCNLEKQTGSNQTFVIKP